MKRLHIPFIFSIAFLSVILFSCSKESAQDPNADPNTMYQVNILGGYFNPDTLIALPGHVITWRNLDAVVHTVVSDDGITFNSGNINPGGSWTFSTNNNFVYPYHCGIHPGEKGVLRIVTR